MKNQKSIAELQKQLKMFKDEENITKKYSEDYKNKISEEIKKFKPAEIKNTVVVEEKFTIWQRILRTLGMN
jgi:hypothetical protein